jgi:internalin A
VDLPGYKKEKTSEARPISVLYSYANEDERYKDVLETHLKILQRQGTIHTWSDRKIEGGANWREEIMNELDRADIILLLISSDFLASDFCYDIEMTRALERDANKEARVIPVIVRDCIWTKAPFAKLQALPKDGKPVKSWPDKDKAWRNVAEGIEKAAEGFRKRTV